MLNKKGDRELAYVVTVDAVEPISGRDRVECARVGGWTCMVPKGAFKAGDPGIYFEIDSKVPVDKEPFGFCAKYNGHIKTQKFKTPDGQFWSQGLLMAAADFGWTTDFAQFAGDFSFIVDDKGVQHIPGEESAFLTTQLGVTYYETEDQKRKAASTVDKYKKMAGRHPQLFKNNAIVKWLYKRNWGKKLLFVFLGKKKDKMSWIPEVKKTDEERIENRSWTLQDQDTKWIATEKVDGSSSTFHLRRGSAFKKPEYFVCSRNVVFDTPEANDKNYYKDTIGNIWLEMSAKYNIKKKLQQLLNERPNAEWVTLQAETFGAGVQKRDYGLKGHEIRVFNLIYSDCGRVGTLEMKKILDKIGLPCVPIISEGMILPQTVEELRVFVHSAPSQIDGGMKEGIVFRTLDGTDSFKCVDPEFLIKFHNN